LGVAHTVGMQIHDPGGTATGFADKHGGQLGPQRPGDFAAMADLVIHCHERDLALALELAADLAMQGCLVGLERQE